MVVDSIWRAVGVLLSALYIGIEAPVHAEAPEPSTGVRPIGGPIATLVTSGAERSPTFRSLLRELDGTGWIVFVQTGSCRLPRVKGCLLHHVGVFEGRPSLRIVLSDTGWADDEVIATIGHELQHAAEVVGDPRIKEGPDIRELYRRIGYVSMRMHGGQLYETRRAMRAGSKVLAELRSTRRVAERMRAARQ